MSGVSRHEPVTMRARLPWRAALALIAAAALAACAGTFSSPEATPPPGQQAIEGPPGALIGAGQVRVALILPLSASGNAGIAAQSMKNAAEMALAEFRNPDIQLLVKDDGGTPQGAQLGAQQALEEGAQIIVGPLFAPAVSAVGQVARPRGVPVIAFSTDANVAARGVYLLSFLPESDVHRIVDFSASKGKRSFAALVPDNAYGAVVEAAFQQAVARRGGRVVALERYPADAARMGEPVRRVAQAATQADALFLPDGADAVPQVVRALVTAGVNMRRLQLLGTGIWADDTRVDAALTGGWYAGPSLAGFTNFSNRYRARYGQNPVRTATLAYDAVALVAALVKMQGPQQGFSEQVLTNSGGFSGIDGIFRFRADGTNERGLAVLQVGPSGPVEISPAPRSFAPGT